MDVPQLEARVRRLELLVAGILGVVFGLIVSQLLYWFWLRDTGFPWFSP